MAPPKQLQLKHTHTCAGIENISKQKIRYRAGGKVERAGTKRHVLASTNNFTRFTLKSGTK